MRPDRVPQKSLAASAQNLSRILIASYFMAVSLKLVAGTDGSVLSATLVPAAYSDLVATVVVFSLAFLVMIGIWLRPAALLLAIILFWSSFISLIGPEALVSVDGFWRDLAMIGALFLTYAQSGRAARQRPILRRRRHVRKLSPTGKPNPRRVTSTVNAGSPNLPAPKINLVPQSVPAVDLKPVPVPEFRSHRAPNLTIVEHTQQDNIFTDTGSLKVTA